MGICGLNDRCTYNLIAFAQLFPQDLFWFSTSNLRLVNSNVLEYLFRHQIVMQKAYCMCGSESTVRNATAPLPSSAGHPLSCFCASQPPRAAVLVIPAHWRTAVWLAWLAVHPPGCPGRVSWFNPPAAALAEKAFWETKRIRFILENLVSQSKPLVN